MPASTTKYKKEYDEQAYKLCLLGHKDTEIAEYFNVKEQTINNWKKSHPSFFESLRNGKDNADYNVAEKLYHRAVGYKAEPEVKTEKDADGVITKIITTTKSVEPDVKAITYWLNNRQSGKWSNTTSVTHGGQITYNCDYGMKE